MALHVEPILPRFGAECSGVDLTKPLDPDEVRQVTEAMDTWGVCIYRNTGMNDDQHVEFSRNFGYLERVPKREGMRMRLPHRELFDASNLNVEGEITQDPAAIMYRKGDRLWHTDSAFMEKRTSYSLLLAHEVPGEGGETWFADTRSAYEDLPQETKDLLEGKIGVNTLWWSRKQAGAEIAEEEIDARPKARHPLVHVCSLPRTRWMSKACPRKKDAS
jgi:alpha-ketoglutarate-dependent 2,4-dichlorophenoxyacetate dioxygenase